MNDRPYCITLKKTDVKSGSLSYIEQSGDLPIAVKRIYWIYDVDNDAERGNHAHANSDRVIICLYGTVEIVLENSEGESFFFLLNNPCQVLFFPRNHWIKLTCSKGSILVVASSCIFSEDEMITNYQEFKKDRQMKSSVN
jgi:WxcM-like, C-terminal